MRQPLLELVLQQFGLQLVEQQKPLLDGVRIQCPPTLLERLETGADCIDSTSNERTRSELLVAPLLLELVLRGRVSLYSGSGWIVDSDRGLRGTVDFLLSRATPQTSSIQPPVTTIVEVKSRQLDKGISHCLVQMIAAQQFNLTPGTVYGVVTTGTVWCFLQLEKTIVTMDLTEYPLFPVEPILSLLSAMVR